LCPDTLLSMYFSSRMQAGRMLASQMYPKLRYENCVVVALDDGGVIVGAQIAIKLHCLIMLLSTQEITLPKETKPIGGITSNGQFTYNNDFSSGEVEEFVSEYREYIEEERIAKYHLINELTSKGSLIDTTKLKHRNVILVSDGLDSPMKLDLADEFLKKIDIDSLIVATPLSNVASIDKVHVMADSVYCLSVIEDYIETSHYYDQNDVPSHDKITKIIKDIIFQWK